MALEKIKLKKILKKENSYSVLTENGIWINGLRDIYGFKEGDEVYTDGKQLFSESEAFEIKKYEEFKKKYRKICNSIKEDYEEALEIFRSLMNREPVGQEFAMLNNIVLQLQKARYFINRDVGLL